MTRIESHLPTDVLRKGLVAAIENSVEIDRQLADRLDALERRLALVEKLAATAKQQIADKGMADALSRGGGHGF